MATGWAWTELAGASRPGQLVFGLLEAGPLPDDR